MNNAQFFFDRPENEPAFAYTEGTPERMALEQELERQSNLQIEIPLIIGGFHFLTSLL